MRIVILGKYNELESLNGPEKVAKRIFQNLTEITTDVVFIEYFFNNRPGSNLFKRLFGYKKISEKDKIFRIGIIRLFFFLLKFRPDILHIITFERFLILIFFYNIFLRAKICSTVHSILRYEIDISPIKKNRFNTLKDVILEKLIFRYSNRLFFLSVQQIELAKKYYTVTQNYCIIENGIDKEFVSINKRSKSDNCVKLVFYNGFEPSIDRGLQFILDSLDTLRCTNTLELHVIGNIFIDINDRHRIFQIKKYSAMDNLELAQFLSDKDIILKSNTFDSFSIFVCECMASGLIPIISDSVGVKRFITDGENGFIYHKNDKNELCSIIKWLLDNRNIFNNISNKAKEISKKLVWKSIAKKYYREYNLLLNIDYTD